jgi:hypothetical protein
VRQLFYILLVIFALKKTLPLSLIFVFVKKEGGVSDSDFPYLCFWQARRYLLRTPPRFTGCVTSLLEKSHKKRIGNSLSCVCVCVCTLTKALTHFSESVHFIFISFRFKLEECKISKQVLSTSTLRWCLRCMA